MAKYCEVCRGERVVTLPLFKQMSAIASEPSMEPMESRKRQYPCPECGEWADTSRIRVIKAHTAIEFDRVERNPEYMLVLKRKAAMALVDFLLRHDSIYFTEQEEYREPLRRGALWATIAVVQRDPVVTMINRLKAHGATIATTITGVIRNQLSNKVRLGRSGEPVYRADDTHEAIAEAEKSVVKIQERYLEGDIN